MTEDKQRKVEKLDVETDQDRQERLGSLFASMTKPEEGGEGVQMPSERTRPFAMPQSDVLSRVRAFLPELAASNDALFARAREDPSSVSIENPTGSHVAMDLGVGVFDVKGDAAVPGNVPVVEGEEWTKGESESESDSSEDEEEEEDVQIKEAKTTRKEKND